MAPTTRGMFGTTPQKVKTPGSRARSHAPPEVGGVHEARRVERVVRVAWAAATARETSNFRGSYLGRFRLDLATFWTNDHRSWRCESVDAFLSTVKTRVEEMLTRPFAAPRVAVAEDDAVAPRVAPVQDAAVGEARPRPEPGVGALDGLEGLVAVVVLRAKVAVREADGGLVEGAVVPQFDEALLDGVGHAGLQRLGRVGEAGRHDEERRARAVLP